MNAEQDMSRIYKISKISKIIGAEDRSSGSPDPEQRMERELLPGPSRGGLSPAIARVRQSLEPEMSRIYTIFTIRSRIFTISRISQD